MKITFTEPKEMINNLAIEINNYLRCEGGFVMVTDNNETLYMITCYTDYLPTNEEIVGFSIFFMANKGATLVSNYIHNTEHSEIAIINWLEEWLEDACICKIITHKDIEITIKG